MRCLACGWDNPTGTEVCGGCASAFEVPAPHTRPDHVGQVREALAAFREGRLDAQDLLQRWQRFLDLAGTFDARWDLSEGGALEPRLDPLLRDRFEGAVAEVDAAWEELGAAASRIDEWVRVGDPDLLEEADRDLEAFFRRACAACAWVDRALQELRTEQGGAGSFVDLRSD